jgi:hypothetical protein
VHPDGPPYWPHARQANGVSDFDLLTHACRDLMEEQNRLLRGIPAGQQPPVLRVDKASVTGERLGELSVTVVGPAGSHLVRLSRASVEAAVAAEEGVAPPLVLVVQALLAGGSLPADWQPRRVGPAAIRPEVLVAYRRVARRTAARTQVEQAVEARRDVLLAGAHGSGKSAVAGHVAEKFQIDGGGLIWLDLSDPADGAESIAMALFTQPASRNGRYLVVVDDLHANRPVLNDVMTCVMRLNNEFGLQGQPQRGIQVLATMWSPGEADRRGLPEPMRVWPLFWVDGPETIGLLVADEGLPAEVARGVRELADGDVHIAAVALDSYRATGRVPSAQELEQHFTRGVGTADRQALYYLACLGLFELELSEWEAQQRFPGALPRLHAVGAVLRTDNAYSIGHLRRAHLVIRHAIVAWQAPGQWGQPEQLIQEHLHAGGDRLMSALLARLDLYMPTDRADETSRYLLAVWQSLNLLVRRLDRMAMTDPTFGGNLAAAVFAAMALAKLGYLESWQRIAEVVRAKWSYDGPTLPETVGPISDSKLAADLQDFPRIKASMRNEDEMLGGPGHSGQPADKIVEEYFYRTWVLGLLLCLEGSAPGSLRDEDRLLQLFDKAKQAQDADGYFYPRRVPWVTARIVLGLCLVGYRKNNPVVRQACDWLLRPPYEGGPLDGWWRSGTGSWNSAEATTAMCVTALLRAGYRPGEPPALRGALDWLRNQKSQWSRSGREVDQAQVLEALARGADYDQTWRDHVRQLLDTLMVELRGPAEAFDGPEKGHRIQFAAAQLADLISVLMTMEFRQVVRRVVDDVVGGSTAADDVVGASTAAQGSPQPTADPLDVEPDRPIDPAVAAPDMVVLGEDDLAIWYSACEQLNSRLNRLIEERSVVRADVRSVRENLTRDLARREEYLRLRRQLHNDTPQQVLIDLNTMGADVCRRAWPDLPGVPKEEL